MYEQASAPWPISNRDFCFAQRYTERFDGIIINNKSIDGVVPEADGFFRGEIVFSGAFIKKLTDDTTQFTSVGCVDPKGSIPSMVVNSSARKQLTKLIALRKALN